MRKRRILLHTNPTHLRTGLAENAKTLLSYLWKTGKYDIAHYCSQVSETDSNLSLTPWKSYGALPADPQAIHALNQDPGKARDAAYGSWNIDKVVGDFKPDVYIGSDDVWGFNGYADKSWWSQIGSILHITVDSLPVLDAAFDQAKKTKYYLTWAKFAAKEMRRLGQGHVGQIYGAMDTNQFAPISPEEKATLRQRFGIGPNTILINYVFRNQLRKSANLILEAFAQFKRENPTADVKLHFHTSVSERAMGWDFPKMIGYYGINPQDVLFTYICKQCGQWHVSPYVGEDVKCPYCGADKSIITVNIANGVPAQEMKYVYGLSDASISAFTSGGQEYHNVQAMLCELPLACTNYSSGEDFCENPDVFTLGWKPYHEAGTNFIKAATRTEDIKRFIQKVWKMPARDVKEWGRRSRVWAKKTFSIETIGAQWEALFDGMPLVDWSTVNMTPAPKNETYPFPQIDDEDAFITALYTNILKMEEPPQGEGRKHWRAQLKGGMTRQQVYDYFLSVARQENAKNQVKPQEISDLFDKDDKKRILYVLKESLGDNYIFTSLVQTAKERYPDHSIYVACDPKFFEVYDGNPYIKKVIPYMPEMEQEMLFVGAGQDKKIVDIYCHVACGTQRVLNYLSNDYSFDEQSF